MVRTRFAPSPTGHLHVGGARTALFNYLFARSQGGVFLVRIEDTDQERSTLESQEQLLESMRWLGLQWDEGPGKEGAFGPYIQSERLDIYQKYVDQLLLEGKAYKCFCHADELEAKKSALEEQGLPIVYDGTCRHLSGQEVREKESKGLPFTVRFRTPPGKVMVRDLVQGDVAFDNEIQGDFIIVKSDGFPTYNFAVVVDDYLMQITHVIRGVGHLSNTPKQMVILEAFGWPVPQYAHVSQIVGTDRKKLSKRHGAASLKEYENQGFLAQALFNYLALLGWSTPDGEEYVDKETLSKVFDISRCNRSDAVFDPEKLRWLNGKYIRDFSLEELMVLAQPFIEAMIQKHHLHLSADDPIWPRLFALLRDYLETLADLDHHFLPMLEEQAAPESEEAAQWLHQAEGRTLAQTLLRLLEEKKPLDRDGFSEILKQAGKEANVKGKALFIPARVAVSGRLHGPDLGLIYEILGYEKTVSRIRHNLELFTS